MRGPRRCGSAGLLVVLVVFSLGMQVSSIGNGRKVGNSNQTEGAPDWCTSTPIGAPKETTKKRRLPPVNGCSLYVAYRNAAAW